jgi:hypothetical protein
MRRRWILATVLAAACSRGPGSTPMEQAPLAIVQQAVHAPILITFETPPLALDELVLVFREFSRTPIEPAVIWQSSAPPSTSDLAQVPGKRIRQYWDPQRKTASTGGRLFVNGKIVPLERVALRVALAQYSALPQ